MSYKILVIDDSADYRALIKVHIGRACPSCTVVEYDPAAKGKPGDDFDWAQFSVALLDYNLGDENGLDWLAEFASRPGFPPVLFMTGEGSERIAARAIKFGAEDYLPKAEINHEALFQAIQEVARQAGTEATAVNPKKDFLEKLERARRSTSKSRPALFLVDIDQADKLKASANERTLARIVKDASSSIRALATKFSIPCHIIEYSNSEIAFLLEYGATEDTCTKIGRIICKEVTESQFEYTNETLTTTASVGIAIISGQEPGVKEILKKTDAACRAAKVRGGNSVYIFPAEKHKAAAEAASPAPVSISSAQSPELAALGNRLATVFKPDAGDGEDIDVADMLKGNKCGMQYLSYKPVSEAAEADDAEFLFDVMPVCSDFAGQALDSTHIKKAAVASEREIDLDLHVSKNAINKVLQFKKEHQRNAALFYRPVSTSLRSKAFFRSLQAMLAKLPNKKLGSVLIYKISLYDYICQPKDFMKSLAEIKASAGIRFCLTDVNDDKLLRLCLHHKVFDFIEPGDRAIMSLSDNNAGDSIAQEIGNTVSNSHASLLITGIDDPEMLMNTLMVYPDYIQGQFINAPSDDMLIEETETTEIEL